MGLLDDVLGGLAGQPMGGHAPAAPTRGGAGDSSTSAVLMAVLMALLPIVLILPDGADRVTPGGDMPDLDALTSTVADLARRFGVR